MRLFAITFLFTTDGDDCAMSRHYLIFLGRYESHTSCYRCAVAVAYCYIKVYHRADLRLPARRLVVFINPSENETAMPTFISARVLAKS